MFDFACVKKHNNVFTCLCIFYLLSIFSPPISSELSTMSFDGGMANSQLLFGSTSENRYFATRLPGAAPGASFDPNSTHPLQIDAGAVPETANVYLCIWPLVAHTDGSGVKACVCDRGFGFNVGTSTCVPCGLNQVKSNVGNTSCTACPANEMSGEAAATCVCQRTYTRDSSGSCVKCQSTSPATLIKPFVGDGACLTCPSNTQLQSGRITSPDTDHLDCICNAGFEGDRGSACTECAAGKYRAFADSIAVDSYSCSHCPAFSISPAGSIAQADCKCNAGYTGPDGGSCTLCDVNTYKETSGSAPCSNCLAGEVTTFQGQTSETACVCDRGYQSSGASGCAECAAGKFKSTVSDSDQCLDCSATQYSAAQATVCGTCPTHSQTTGAGQGTQLSDCTCNAGYGTDSQTTPFTCTACVAGQRSYPAGTRPTSQTPQWVEKGPGEKVYGHVVLWMIDPVYDIIATGEKNVSELQRIAQEFQKLRTTQFNGFLYTNDTFTFRSFDDRSSSFETFTYDNNAHGSWFAIWYTSEIQSDVLNQEIILTRNQKAFALECLGGQYYKPATTWYQELHLSIFDKCIIESSVPYCDTCPPNTYTDAAAQSACQACPSDSSIPASSSQDSASRCECNAGFYRSGQDSSSGAPICTQCQAGKYKESVSNLACTDCGVGTYSAAVGALNRTTCLQCLDTRAHSSSAAGSTSLADCKCDAGYMNDGSGKCVPCPPGSFCPGADVVTSCTDSTLGYAHTTSNAGATSKDDCFCIPGYFGIPSSACQVCPENSYCPGGTNSVGCGLLSESPPGSDSSEDCVCPNGYFIDDSV